MNKLLDLVKTKVGCGYVWGSQGEILTTERLQRFKNEFGAQHYDLSDGTKASKWVGKQVFDCSGLIVWALRTLQCIPETADATAQDILKTYCTPIGYQELQPGDLLFKRDDDGDIIHVGVFVGDGKTIEAKSTALGVVQGALTDFNIYARLKFNLADYNSIVRALLRSGAIVDPNYWELNLVPGKMVKADYVIKVLKVLLKL